MKRYLTPQIAKELAQKMVLLAGPRQVGKITLSHQLLASASSSGATLWGGRSSRPSRPLLGPKADEHHPAYLSWDFPETRASLLEGELPAKQKLIVLDEIHKYFGWRNLLKGLYDKNKSHTQFLVTGSAKLDYYRRGGDSLIGRYHLYRLHPLSLYELNPKSEGEKLARLLEFGGFPEMYLKADKALWKKWQKIRTSKIILEDLSSLEQIKEVSKLELLSSLLPSRVGTIVPLESLRRELSCSHDSVSRWIQILENVYYCYRIHPFELSRTKALKKAAKIYLWDWSSVEGKGEKFENLVASNLLKYCHYHEDVEGDTMELRLLRDKAGREVDFVVLKNKRPLFAVECKLSKRGIDKSIPYYAQKMDIPFYQVHGEENDDWSQKEGGRIQTTSFTRFCHEVLKV